MKTLTFILSVGMAIGLVSCGDSGTPSPEETSSIKVITTTYENGKTQEEYQQDTSKNVKDGYYKMYHENGQLALEHHYKMGKQEGLQKAFYPSGKIETEATYVNGELEGVYKDFHENGKIKQEATYKAGKMVGIMKLYHENGGIYKEETMVDGLTKGSFTEYHENGKISAKGTYTNNGQDEGIEDGLLEEFNEEGELIRKAYCGLTSEGKKQCCSIWKIEGGDVKKQIGPCVEIVEAYKAKEKAVSE